MIGWILFLRVYFVQFLFSAVIVCMSSILQTRVPLLQALNSCNRRLLTDKPRNRKWNLPPVKSDNSSSPANRNRSDPSPVRPTLQAYPIKKAQTYPASKNNPPSRKLEDWAARKLALKQKYPEGWKPAKRLSPDAMEGIRILHRQVRLSDISPC